MGGISYKPSTWMTDMWSSLADRPLKSVCLPGSHDSAMSVLNIHTRGSTPGNTMTQSLSIAEQLAQGARYFDLRPTLWDGVLYSGHLTDTIVGWEGSAGEVMADILISIEKFLSQTSPAPINEIIILNFSHYLDYSTGGPLSEMQIITLMDKITATIPEYIVKFSDSSVWLGERTLKEIRDHGNVVCIFDDIYFTNPATGTFSISTDDVIPSHLTPAIAFDDGPGERLLAVYCPRSECIGPSLSLQRRKESERLAFTYYDTSTQIWARPMLIPDVNSIARQSASVVVNKDNIYVIYASADSNELVPAGTVITGTLAIVTSSDRGATWNTPQMLGGRTRQSPSAAMDPAGNIYVVYTAANDTGEILIQKITCSDQGAWSSTNGVKINEATGNAPALAWDNSTGTLCALFTKRDSTKLLFSRSEPNNWSRWTGNVVINQSTDCAPALAADKSGNLYAVFRADDDTTKPLCVKLNAGTTTWSGNVEIDSNSVSAPPAVAVSPASGGVLTAFVTKHAQTLARQSTDGGTPWQGFGITNLPIYDNYAESNDCDQVVRDQIDKYHRFNSCNGGIFVMSWTATLTTAQSLTSFTDTIKDVAERINAKLQPEMQALIKDGSIGYKTKVPNVLYVDYYTSSVLDVAVEINQTP